MVLITASYVYSWLVYFFCEMSVQFLCLTEFGCFLFLLSWRNYLYILNLSSLLDICFKYFLCDLHVHLIGIMMGRSFKFWWSPIYQGCFVVVVWSFGGYCFLCLRNIWLAPINKDILLFCSEMLMISSFTFRSFTCLILHFVYGIK